MNKSNNKYTSSNRMNARVLIQINDYKFQEYKRVKAALYKIMTYEMENGKISDNCSNRKYELFDEFLPLYEYVKTTYGPIKRKAKSKFWVWLNNIDNIE